MNSPAPPGNANAPLAKGRREKLTGRGENNSGHTFAEVCAVSGETSRRLLAQKTCAAEKCTAGKGHYKPIATEFKHGGCKYRQIAREGDLAIFEQRWRDSENVCYEVVRIRRLEAKTFPNGKSSPAREAYPSSAAWGDFGWTVTTLDAAFAKLRELA